MQIDFYVSQVEDQDVERLLHKLDLPFESLKADVENKTMSAVKVLGDYKLLGIICVRIETNHHGDNEFVVLHTIAEDNIKVNFYNILGQSLPSLSLEYGCDIIRHHADRPGMIKMLGKYNYQVTELVFRKRISEPCQAQNQALTKQASRQPLIKTTELPTSRE